MSGNMKIISLCFTLHQGGLTGSKVQTVVERYFAEVAPDKHLKILSIKGLAEAASRFVDKDDKEAMFCLVE
jgi:hypothetical protein